MSGLSRSLSFRKPQETGIIDAEIDVIADCAGSGRVIANWQTGDLDASLSEYFKNEHGMSFIEKIKALMKSAREQKQIVGYSESELRSQFSRPLAVADFSSHPPVRSLESADICAFFSQFLIEPKDLVEFESLVEFNFRKNTERTFNDLPVFEYESALNGDRLIFFASTREFNSVTIRLITNSLDFLTMLNRKKFAVPPPWFAFEGYEPSWWGGSMQGAQEYYDNNYFFSFFTQLSAIEKQSYYSRFNATDDWIERLELMYDTE